MSKKKSHKRGQPHPSNLADRGWFDGSADPNPGGRLGMGWHWVLRDQSTYARADEAPPSPANTNNRAEYQALLGLLTDYIAQGHQGPLLVHGDSELIINQVNGDYAVHDAALARLCDRVEELSTQIPDGVSFRWVPRRENSLADRLAGGMGEEAARAPRVQVFAVSPPEGISPKLAKLITQVNRQDSLGFRDGMSLKVGGQDQYSSMKLVELGAAAGEVCCTAVDEVLFPRHAESEGTQNKLRERALRWCLRGLEAHHAARKVLIDAEVSANAQQGRKRRA